MIERFSELERMKANQIAELGHQLANETEFRYLKFLFQFDGINKQLSYVRQEASNQRTIIHVLIGLQIILLALVLWRVW